MAQILHAVGYDHDIALHRNVYRWITELTYFDDRTVRAIGTWGLGDIGIPPYETRSRLLELATRESPPDEPFQTSLEVTHSSLSV